MIDYDFIEELEGNSLAGYVPDSSGSNSGVTIASGFDLGQHSHDELRHLLPAPLLAKLAPYFGLTKIPAVNAIRRNPLVITDLECSMINLISRHESERRLVARWNRACNTPFSQIPTALQTVVASVAYQYGNLSVRCPNFWAAATELNIPKLLGELRDFGDNYGTRRHKEADYLEQGVRMSELSTPVKTKVKWEA